MTRICNSTCWLSLLLVLSLSFYNDHVMATAEALLAATNVSITANDTQSSPQTPLHSDPSLTAPNTSSTSPAPESTSATLKQRNMSPAASSWSAIGKPDLLSQGRGFTNRAGLLPTEDRRHPCRTPSPQPTLQRHHLLMRLLQSCIYTFLGIDLVSPIDPNRALVDRRVNVTDEALIYDFRTLDRWDELSLFQLDQLTPHKMRLIQPTVFQTMDPNILSCLDSPILDAISREQSLAIPYDTLQRVPKHVYKHLGLHARRDDTDALYYISIVFGTVPYVNHLFEYFKNGYQIEVALLTTLLNAYKIIVNGIMLELPVALFNTVKMVLRTVWVYVATSRFYVWLIRDLITLEKIIDIVRYYAKRFKFAVTHINRQIKYVVTSFFSYFKTMILRWIRWILPFY